MDAQKGFPSYRRKAEEDANYFAPIAQYNVPIIQGTDVIERPANQHHQTEGRRKTRWPTPPGLRNAAKPTDTKRRRSPHALRLSIALGQLAVEEKKREMGA